MNRFMLALHRAIALSVLCVLLAAPAALAQPVPDPEPPQSSELTPASAAPPAAAFDRAADVPTAPSSDAPADHSVPQLAPVSAPQAAGDERWDDRFGVPGVPDRVTTLEVAPDGTFYAGVGLFTSQLMRWSGRGWQNLGGELDGDIADMALSGTTLYAVGDFKKAGTASAKHIAKWNGSTWSRVGSGVGPEKVDEWGAEEGDLYAIAVVGTNIYVGGNFNRIDGVDANGIARWDGAKWNAIGDGVQNENSFDPIFVSGEVYTIVPDGGKLYIGGRFELAGGAQASSIAVLNGSTWSTLGAGMVDDDSFDPAGSVRAIAISGGTIYAGGNFDRAGGQLAENIAKWNGSAWSALDSGLGVEFEDSFDQPVRAIVVSGANVYAGGEFETAGGEVAKYFANWNGSAWSAVGVPDADMVFTLALGPGGVYVGGQFITAGDKLANNIALWTGSAWSALGQGITEFATSSYPGDPRALAVDSAGRVYVGGRFKTVGGLVVNNIAMWDGTKWNALGAGLEGDGGLDDGSVAALAIVGNDLYVGGSFTKAGGASARHLAKYNLTSKQWSQVGGGVDGQVYALTFSNGLLYVGGDFDTVGTVNAKDIATWNGAAWQALGNSLQIYQVFDSCSEQSTHVYSISVAGNLVYVGGNFRLVYKGTGSVCSLSSYLLANHLLVYDRAQNEWFMLGNSVPGVTNGSQYFAHPVSALHATGDDLYVGGHFGNAGTVTAAGIARFNLTSGWSAVSGGISGTRNNGALSTGPEVRALLRDGPYLYVAGDFTATGGGPAENIARYDLGNRTWAALGSGLTYQNGTVTVQALARGPNGIYVGGKFSLAGGKGASGLSHWIAGATPSQNKRIYLPTIAR
jgi:trimeric autotransporter adhesin